jgi:hypothetical protein
MRLVVQKCVDITRPEPDVLPSSTMADQNVPDVSCVDVCGERFEADAQLIGHLLRAFQPACRRSLGEGFGGAHAHRA